ncbi:Protein phosphatase 1 regulatory subunit 15A [Eufriesea mexicana]|uniref:Protein DP71L n=2 Tax=Eufriesea mexicana TaxID=516756 RepID=A0A310SGU1_9HYME|nr:Protein phosphatase 1 regulatory subunit 15A [Eufriesea mexicana]
MLHSVFNALNIVWEQFSKVPASFIASINYPLSVTVVNNGDIISHDFFKNLTNKTEPLNTDNVYIHDAQVKESLNIVERIHNDTYNEKKSYMNKIFNENMKDSFNFGYEYIANKNHIANKSDQEESIVQQNVEVNTNNYNYLIPVQNLNKISEEDLFEYICPNINTQKMYARKNCYNIEDNYSRNASNKGQLFNYTNNNVNDKMIMNMETSFLTRNIDTLSIQSVEQITMSNMFTKMLQKVFSGVTDRLCRADFVESDLAMKRSFSPNQRRRLNAVAKSRGRGRAKSQLRRSGVSQTRHRKERIKHDIAVDIESDFRNWQELQMYHTMESFQSQDCFSLDEDVVDAVQHIMKETVDPLTYTLADIKPKIQKPKTRKNVDQGISKFSTKMRSIPECIEQTNIFEDDFLENRYNLQMNTFRPRLISESSIDSEDSYCIVFETGSEITCTSDLDDNEEIDVDQTSEESDIVRASEDEETCKDEGSISPVQKVKFNLNPMIHIMVKWDYAYRAARKGPWEEMARDRERFRSRINCIERVLNPILTVQHRNHIWQERFVLTD